MNIEELNLEYKAKMDALMEEYKAKVKEVTKKEEPFIKKGQRYFAINSEFDLDDYCYINDDTDKNILECGNMFPFTDENREEVEKEVNLIAEHRKLQSEMEMFARQNNKGKIDWNNGDKEKWFLYIDCGEITISLTYHHRDLNVVYFTSEEITKKALEKFGDRIRELYIDSEDAANESTCD